MKVMREYDQTWIRSRKLDLFSWASFKLYNDLLRPNFKIILIRRKDYEWLKLDYFEKIDNKLLFTRAVINQQCVNINH